jgi:tight adherence protein B
MGALLGLLLGAGLLLIWLAATGDGWRTDRPPGEPRLRGLLQRAGVEGVTPGGVMSLSVASAVGGGLVMLAVSQTVPVAIVFAGLGGYLPTAVLQGRARRRQREFAELWPEAVDNLASAVRAGLSLPEALTQLGARGPEPLREPFVKFGRDYHASGRFGDSLDLLKQRLADPVGDRVCEALRIARDVGGGDLGRMLRALSGFLRDDARTRSELESRQAWTVNGARLAVAAPWLVLILMSFQSETIQRYQRPAGVAILVGGAGLCLLAYRLMTRLGRLPVERRILS